MHRSRRSERLRRLARTCRRPAEHWFGTTGQGQDVFEPDRLGSRATLSVGLLVGVLTTVVGIVVGMTAGYFGGIDRRRALADHQRLPDHPRPAAAGRAGRLPRQRQRARTSSLVLTVTGWAWPARVLRSQTLSLREKDFVAAAEVSGESGSRIIFGEILPNMLSIVVASFIGSTIFAIGA